MIELAVVDPAIAELTISADRPTVAGPRLELEIEGTPPTYRLHAGPTRYELAQRMDPDEPWQLTSEPSGSSAGTDFGDAFWGEPWAGAFATLAAGSGLEASGGAFLALPPGRYLVVRAPSPSELAETVLLGNTYVPRPSWASTLLDAPPVYAAVLHAGSDRPSPGLHLAAALLDASGTGAIDALWFARVAGPTSAGDGSSLWLVPVEGPLVASASFGPGRAEDRARDEHRWRAGAALSAARAIAGHGSARGRRA